MNLITIFSAFAITIAGVHMTVAEESKIDPLTQVMIDTWEPSATNTLRIFAGSKMAEWTKSIDGGGLNEGITTMKWTGCEFVFGVTRDDEPCKGYNGPGHKFYNALWEYVTNGDFIETVDQNTLSTIIVDKAGEGRVKTQLKPLVEMMAEPYDPNMALDYQRWRANWCNFLFIEGEHYARAENRDDKPTKEECSVDPFAIYLTETYCSSDSCDLGRLSWTYGFLTRRYMWGGDKAVQQWQQLMFTTAKEVGIKLPQPHWLSSTLPTNN